MEKPFTWDPQKAATNSQKHQMTFEEAQTVFDDPLAVIFDDESHSTDEVREIIVGHSLRNRLLLVSFTERATSIRIISARRATDFERRAYEEGTGYV